MCSPEPKRSPPKRSPTASTVRENGSWNPPRSVARFCSEIGFQKSPNSAPTHARYDRGAGDRRHDGADARRARTRRRRLPSASGFDRRGDHEQHADRSAQPGEEPRPGRPPESPGAEPEEHDDAQHHRGGFRVPDHQDGGGREQRREPCRRAGPSPHHRSRAARAGAATRRTRARTRSRSASSATAVVPEQHPPEPARQHRHQREEPQRRLPDRAVSVLGDVAVERGVPGEEALTERHRAGRGPRPCRTRRARAPTPRSR